MQGTWVRALVREDSTCHGATKPMHHNYWAHMPQLLKPARLGPMLHNKRSHRNEKPAHCSEEQPPLTATRESTHAATKTQSSQNKKQKTNKNKPGYRTLYKIVYYLCQKKKENKCICISSQLVVFGIGCIWNRANRLQGCETDFSLYTFLHFNIWITWL